MNKLSTLVLVATIGLTAPAFADTLSQSRSYPFLASDTSQTPVVTNDGIGSVKAEAEAEKPAAAPMKKATPAQKASKKHAHKTAAKAPAKKKKSTTTKTTVKKTTSSTTESK